MKEAATVNFRKGREKRERERKRERESETVYL